MQQTSGQAGHEASAGGGSLLWRCWPYLAALVGVAAVTALCLGLRPVLGGHGVFLFYLLPLLWVGWRYGSVPFLLGTTASVVAGLLVIAEAHHPFTLATDHWIHLVSFLSVAVVFLLLRARERALRLTVEETAERLRISEGHFRAMFAAEPVGVAQVDSSGIWLSANAALCRMLAYTEQELSAKSVIEVTHPDDRLEDGARFAQIISGRALSVNWEKRYLRKDGSSVWAHVSIAPVFNERGQVDSVVKVMQDISEVVAARQVLARDKEQLEALVAERTASLQEMTRHLNFLLYTIAHDLRAPLRAQHGYSDLLLLNYGPVLGQKGEEYLSRIKAAAVRLDDLVSDVLSYASINRKALPVAEVKLSQIAAIATEELSQLIAQQQATVHLNNIQGVVIAHDGALRLIVSNLLSNALKFVPKGVRPIVRVWSERRDGFFRLWVEDNGLGISPENHEIIFGIFQKLNSEPDYPGTGIGLALVKSGIERMGGRVGLQSELGKGSSFWVDVPAAK
jgi:PAS domain S-box-containing protein